MTSEEQALLERAAQGVVSRGLAAPALMLLESLRPLNFLGSQGLAFFEPIATAAFDPEKYKRFRKLLEKRSAVSALIHAIERLEKAKGDR